MFFNRKTYFSLFLFSKNEVYEILGYSNINVYLCTQKEG